jgi:catechol 2,3-dioxygenase-like lactoylglutathione lyase family enzyme
MQVHFKQFRGILATWPQLMQEAADFSTTIGPARLINISQSEDDDDGVIAVWYWDEDPTAPGASTRRAGGAELSVPILPADDLAIARQFYVDALGFGVTFDTSEDGDTGLLGLQRGGLELTIDAPMDGHGREAAVSLHVADADALYAEWSQAVEALERPKSEAWGARTFSVIDPSGNTLFVIGPALEQE